VGAGGSPVLGDDLLCGDAGLLQGLLNLVHVAGSD
jgi:hypothetical protein